MSRLLLVLLSCVPAMFLGLTLGCAAGARWDRLMPRWLPPVVLVPGLLLIAWHFRRISDFIAPSGYVTDRPAAASELEMLGLALPFAVVAVWGLAILLVRRLPIGALAFPIFATQLYLFGVAQAAPLVREVIDTQSAWLSLLVAGQVPMTIAVGGFLWSALGRAGLLARWPLRER